MAALRDYVHTHTSTDIAKFRLEHRIRSTCAHASIDNHHKIVLMQLRRH